MSWVEFWAMMAALEKVIGLIILALIVFVFGGLWLIISVTDWWEDRKRKRKKKL